ncbi:TonB-dependent receptor [Sphingobium sp. AN558]|uniref:TonB-dependent receptor domain-containing protein n=1 Tax=Sphingobium sp. AN558 TaxID=3133442 RepID=UPI0030BC6707
MALASLLAEPSFVPSALARETDYRIDIPAGPLSASLARFSQLTGISIGLPGDMPPVRTHAVAGRMSPDAALQIMLDGSGLHARRMGDVYRIELMQRTSVPRLPAPPSLRAATLANRSADIIVTAQKRPQMLASIPLSVAIVSLDDMTHGSTSTSSRDITLSTEGLAMTNLGPGRNRQFIRGVADSPFNGQSQSTVTVQVDNARVIFDAPDPDLRLADVERVEILKGPQGPLYGSGAIGGIYHIVTRRPELDKISIATELSTGSVQHGGIGTGIEGVVNLPILTDRLAVRSVGYRIVNAGWIDNADGRENSNSVETVGLRLGIRWQAADDWRVDAGVIQQDINVRDSQYVVAGMRSLKRTNGIAEPTDNDFKLAHVTIEGRLGALQLVSATSYVDHGLTYALDASEAAGDFSLTGPARFTDSRAYTLFNQELRLSSEGVDHWLMGASFLRATTSGASSVADDSDEIQIVERIDRKTSEYAVFGEATWRLFSRIDATVGARLSHSFSEDEAAEGVGSRILKGGKTILSPSAALSLPLGGRGIVYLRFSRAMRPGGLTATGQAASGRFDADELDTLDLGIRRSSRDGRLALSASAYATQWNDIQSDYLLDNGLISTRNAGRGRILGFEASLDWHIGGGFSLSGGGTAQSARLTHAQNGIELDDLRLPITPSVSGRLSIAKTFALARWRGLATVQANYIGSARLSFDSDLDREMGEYSVFSAHSEMSRGPWTLGFRLDNLLDVKGDSFAFGNPFSIRAGQQFTPVRPRSLSLSIARSW